MNRRFLLKSAAGQALALWMASGAAIPVRAEAADPPSPWAPWTADALRRHSDFRIRAIAHAVLAPNPQNLQPWLCELPSEDRIVLRIGGERRLSAADQTDRQLTVGLGAFCELLVLALRAEGYDADVTPFPEGESWPVLDGRPVAVFALRKTEVERDPLLDSILARHTNRTPFDESRKVSAAQLATIRAAARDPEGTRTNLDPALASTIKDITLRAYEATIGFAPTRNEVARWTRIGNAAIASTPYGPAIGDAALAKAAGPVAYETLSDPASAVFQANRAGYRRAVQTGWAHVWVVAPTGDRVGMFGAGRDWVRVHLQATALGLDMQPHSQSIQNFPEIEPYVREIHAALGVAAPARIQMLGRVGYGSPVTPSPRLPADAIVRA